ncbi:hypothetical protein OKA04_23305 [Luteolibacter flavescens]|uniref:Uncharacterized protein n=1 Tax=Luteolibacter flavescens TaxID=1859460 RepID=A0ABT3FWJ1_9BACT|nr:hypothetical protein [Luteolibacter flavescens]MCW1887684.1 hypothetical protein [Luteolibacter flavescens]
MNPNQGPQPQCRKRRHQRTVGKQERNEHFTDVDRACDRWLRDRDETYRPAGERKQAVPGKPYQPLSHFA